MNNRKRIATTLLAASILFAPSIAAAACTQADLTGNWKFYFWNGVNNWFQCTLKVAANGDITSNKKCVSSAGDKYTVDAGQKLTMAQGGICRVAASVHITIGMTHLAFDVTDGTFESNHQTIFALGTAGGDHVFFNLTKY